MISQLQINMGCLGGYAPLHLNITISYIQIKICLPKLTLDALIYDIINITEYYWSFTGLLLECYWNISDYCSNIPAQGCAIHNVFMTY